MAEGIRYARNGGLAIAYQVVGEGETDLVYCLIHKSCAGWRLASVRSRQRHLS